MGIHTKKKTTLYMYINNMYINNMYINNMYINNMYINNMYKNNACAVAYPERVLRVLEQSPRPKLQPLVNDNVNTAWRLA